jgi:hypothetical protein
MVVCTAGLGVLFATYSMSPAPVARGELPARADEDRVQIEHQFVRIPVTQEVSAAIAASHRPVRRARRPPQAVPAAARLEEQRPFLQRAVRKIVGDGRYAPQPFPRPK